MLEPFSRLFSRIEDKRKTKHTVALLSPVGDISMLKEFIFTLKKQSYKDYDLFFIYPKGVEFYKDDDFSILSAEEALPLGTSGCFFAGQAFLYSEGYEVIVVADLDAVPSSKDMLGNLVRETRRTSCACLPYSTHPESIIEERGYNVNQYGAYPRQVFEKVGFSTPYLWRGGEDWDLLERLRAGKMLLVLEDEIVSHPDSGYTFYHKMANRKKFYPYSMNCMRSLLFLSKFSKTNIVKYALWYIYYRFFSVVFSDADLAYGVRNSGRFMLQDFKPSESPVRIEKIKEKGFFGRSTASKIVANFSILARLLIWRKTEVYIDRFTIKNDYRTTLLIHTLLAAALVPVYVFESLAALMTWNKEKEKVIYPIFPDSLPDATLIFERYISEKKL